MNKFKDEIIKLMLQQFTPCELLYLSIWEAHPQSAPDTLNSYSEEEKLAFCYLLNEYAQEFNELCEQITQSTN